MKKGILSLLTWSLPFLLLAQSFDSAQDEGIKWTTGLSWNQVKQKAKEENKYIFIDAFTTWCGPCKAMDKQVYSNDTIGSLFNEKFIAVKVQMDKTDKDNDQIKSWYQDANFIAKQYHVEAYPSFIFLSPNGDIVQTDIGFKSVPAFIQLAKTALTPGKVYNDPYKEFLVFVDSHHSGQRDYDRYPAMIKTAFKINDTTVGFQLIKELTNYVISLSPSKRYTKDRIEMWATFNIGSGTRIFQFFYKDGKLIDKVMNKNGYAEKVVDNTIKAEIIDPFFKEENTDSSIFMSGMMMTGKGLKANLSEANWEKLKRQINENYNSKYAERNVLKAKIEWYKRHRNNIAYAKTYLLFLKKFPPDFSNLNEASSLNSLGWSVFLHITDKSMIDKSIKFMKRMFEQNKDIPDSEIVTYIDTYANLLYKARKVKKAVNWERRAVNAAAIEQLKAQFNTALDQMNRREPTYGALWGYN